MQKSRRTAPARQASTKSASPRKAPTARALSTSSGTEVVDHLTATRAVELGISAERLRWVANWHDRFGANRHFLIGKRLRQVADILVAANDNAAQRRAA